METRAEETEVIEGEVVGAPADLPATVQPAVVERARDEVRTAALVAAGGVVAGVATVAAVHVARSGARRLPIVGKRRGADRGGIVASRSFLIDVHVLGR